MQFLQLAGSKAGTFKQYAVGQIRPVCPGTVNFQFTGSDGNRPYGLALRVAAPVAFYDWLANQQRALKSLANTGEAYMPVQVRVVWIDCEPYLHAQVIGGFCGNRAYGYSVNLPLPDDAEEWFAQVDCG